MNKIHALGILSIVVVALLCYIAVPADWVRPANADASETKTVQGPDPDPRPTAGGVHLGKWLFRRNCSACHGPEGVGGTINPNYIKDTYPQLNVLAERMMISDSEDAKAVVDLLSKGQDLNEAELDIAKPNVVLAQFNALRDVVRKGSKPGKKDADGPEPTAMPTWGPILKDEEIYSIFAYLITLQKWEDEEAVTTVETHAEPGTNHPIQIIPRDPSEQLDAKLTNQDGKEFKLSELRTEVVILSFMYSRCSVATLCPMLGKKLAEVQDRLAAQGIKGVRFLLVSFDPFDKPERLREFGAKYDIDFSNFWFATGAQEEIGPLARKVNNYYQQRAENKFEHNIVVGIVDRNGRICDDFFGTEWDIEEFVGTIQEISAKR